MRSNYSTRILSAAPVVALMMVSAISAQAGERKLDSHEHGVSKLQIAQEGNKIGFELEAPGKDIVGFEYAPKNEAEKTSVKTALVLFESPENLFTFPANARCEITDKKAEFETSQDHAEFHVTWMATCEAVTNADSLQTSFFATFDNAQEIEIEAIGSAGQVSLEVEKGTTAIDLLKVIGE